jgi:hypothetical protein
MQYIRIQMPALNPLQKALHHHYQLPAYRHRYVCKIEISVTIHKSKFKFTKESKNMPSIYERHTLVST